MGATSVLPYLRAASAAFMSAHPGYRVTLAGGGSVAGLVEVSRGRVDLAVADIPPRSEWTQGVQLCHTALGRLPILFIAHQGLVTHLSATQLREILVGRIRNWSAVGGPHERIVVVSRSLASGALQVVERQLLGGQRVTSHAIVMLSNGAVFTTVRETPGAIGYVESGQPPSGVAILQVDQHRFARHDPGAWPYYAVPTLYWRCPGDRRVRDVAGYLASQPWRREFGLF